MQEDRSLPLRAVIGMTMMIAGGFVISIGGMRKFAPLNQLIQQRLKEASNRLSNLANPQPPQLLHCTYCNTDNDVSSKTCQNCGAALVQNRRCPGCGQKFEGDARFCSHCGQAL
jgi:membrane protease subunit (stomatin/prohibitin family)